MLGQLVGEIMVFEPMAVTELSVKGLAVETRFAASPELTARDAADTWSAAGGGEGRVVHSHISDVDQDVVTTTPDWSSSNCPNACGV